MKLGIVYHMPFWRAPDGMLYELEGSFARYVDSLAPYFDEIVLCVPFLHDAGGEGTPVRSPNVSIAPLPAFDGPVAFYPRLLSMVPRLLQFVRGIDLLHCRIPTPAAVFAYAWARLLGRPAFVLVVGDLRALLPSIGYRGFKMLLWRCYTAFEELGMQWMVNGSLAFANGAALAAKHTRPGRAVIETRTTTIETADIASREDTCGGPAIRLLTVSRIDPRKGLRILPETLRLLVDRGLDVTIDIVGPAVGAPGEAERVQIDADASARGVSGRLRFVGAIPLRRLLPLYGNYDVFVLPTLPGEGIPRVLHRILHPTDFTSGSALATMGAYSRSVNSTFASPWSSMKAMASASRRVLSVFTTAPNIAGPKCSSIIAGTLGSIAATVSPRFTPRFCSAEASRQQRS